MNGCFVEYFALDSVPEYALKIQEKARLAEQAGVKLVALYPEDLSDLGRLEKKLAHVIASPQASLPPDQS